MTREGLRTIVNETKMISLTSRGGIEALIWSEEQDFEIEDGIGISSKKSRGKRGGYLR